METLLSIGKILNFHGILGEVKVGYTKGKEAQLTKITKFFTSKNNKKVALTAENIRFHKQFALIKFKEISSINEAVEFKGYNLLVEKSEIADTLEEDEYYINDLVGLEVYDNSGTKIGNVASVATIRDEDLISIKMLDGKEHLVPFVKDLVPEVDIKSKKIVINNIPGLLSEIEEED